MSDPARLMTSSASEDVRDLLREARASAPPGLKERAMATAFEALLAPAAVAAGAAAAAKAGAGAGAGGAAKTSALTTVHWVGLACLVGVCAAGGFLASRADRATADASPQAVERASVPLPPAPTAAASPAPSDGWYPVPVQVASLPPAPGPVPPPAIPSPSRVRPATAAAAPAATEEDELGTGYTPPPAPPASAAPKLQPEIVLLDLTRKSLGEGYGVRALTLLRDYDARFPDGALRSEATMLRIEALIATGRRDEAARLGRSVIDRDPDGPYVARIRSLLGETNP